MALTIPSITDIQTRTLTLLGVRPCRWQAQVAQVLLRGDNDIISIAGTGSGKTLTFWIPLLFRTDGIQIVATPLNILGKQNEGQLAKVGMKAIAIRADNATHENWKAIEDGRYRAVIISPEEMYKKDGGFSSLAKNNDFTARIIGVIWDEGHCLGASSWGTFRSVYKDAGRLRHILPRQIPYYVTSATLDAKSISEVMSMLQMRSDKLLQFHRSNDRPNIHISVRKIKRSLKSFADLDFLLPRPGQPWAKALVFFDSIAESVAAAKALQKRLPPGLRVGIKWFNSDMSSQYRDNTQGEYKEGGIWALYCTDSFGMGVDLPDIDLVVQWRVTCDMRTLWQQFGRAARDLTKTGKVLLLAEAKWFDEDREKKKAGQEKRAAKAAKRKAQKQAGPQAAKRTALPSTGANGGPSIVPARSTVDLGEPESDSGDDVDGSRGGSAPPTNMESGSASSREATRQEHHDRLRDLYLESRLAEEKAARSGRKKASKKPQELSPELDNLVNAGTRPHRCYRVPVLAFFASDKINASDHKLCRQDLPDGCQRCCTVAGGICCELCSPAAFVTFAELIDSPAGDHTTIPGRSRKINTTYRAMESDTALRLALHDFRQRRTIERLSEAALDDMGPGAFMSNAVLQRIVDCGRIRKITSIEDLQKETQWKRAKADQEEVVRLVAHYFPRINALTLAPLVRTPLAPRAPQNVPHSRAASGSDDVNVADGTTATPRLRRNKCGRCGLEGHIARNRRVCMAHPEYVAPPTITATTPSVPIDENAPPVDQTEADTRAPIPSPDLPIRFPPARAVTSSQCASSIIHASVAAPVTSSSALPHTSTPQEAASPLLESVASDARLPRPRPRPRPVITGSRVAGGSTAGTFDAVAATGDIATVGKDADQTAGAVEISVLPRPVPSNLASSILHAGAAAAAAESSSMPPPATAFQAILQHLEVEGARNCERLRPRPRPIVPHSASSSMNTDAIAVPSSMPQRMDTAHIILPHVEVQASASDERVMPSTTTSQHVNATFQVAENSDNHARHAGLQVLTMPPSLSANPLESRGANDESQGTSCNGYYSPFPRGAPFAYHAYSTAHHSSLTSSFPHLLYDAGPSARFVGGSSPSRRVAEIPTTRFYSTLPQLEQEIDEDDGAI